MKDEEKIKEIAKQIFELETKYRNTQDTDIEKEIEKMTENLSLEELLEVDEYIFKNTQQNISKLIQQFTK